MLSKIFSVALSGLDGQLVEIEVDTRMSLPGFSIVGLPDAAVQEARERVISAIKNCDIALPRGKIVVNLAPANLKKVGALYDLPMALGLSVFSGVVKTKSLKDTIFVGELALDGAVRPVPGILSIVEFAKSQGFSRLYLPKANAREASMISGIKLVPVGHLKEAIKHINGQASVLDLSFNHSPEARRNIFDMAMIKGQSQAKRAIEIAAAGGHNVLLNGAPGAGKTMLARAMSGILPDMSQEEMMEVTKIYSVAGLLTKERPLIRHRPFRPVHHTASSVSLVGGGMIPVPGEITLAHRGVLFMDEVAEFPSQVLEVLRQPMEDREITISRARASITFPAQFTLVGSMNPCPCGYFNVKKFKGRCDCPMWKVRAYYKKLSGPLLDRIDLNLKIEPVEHDSLVGNEKQESSSAVKQRVNRANDMQRARFKGQIINRNVEMNSAQTQKFCPLDSKSKRLLDHTAASLNMSARSYFKVIKVARTIADLELSEHLKSGHIGEALQYTCDQRPAPKKRSY